MINPLAMKRRALSSMPTAYGAYYGEGLFTMTTSNHRWPKGATLKDATVANSRFQFAEWEARETLGDTRRNGSNRGEWRYVNAN